MLVVDVDQDRVGSVMQISGQMRWHIGDDYAHLKYVEDDNAIHIDTIFVPAAYRCRGIGHQLMQRILAMADSQGKSVELDARPIGTTSEEDLQRLIQFYRRYGFDIVARGNCKATMKRTAAVIISEETKRARS